LRKQFETLAFWLDLASFARSQLVRKFSHFGERGDDIPTSGKSQFNFRQLLLLNENVRLAAQ
jgi:hypothetical protein